MAAVEPITLEQFEEAQQTIIDVAVRTPLLKSDWLSEYIDSPVFFKCENLQRTGSFKLRGAYNIISKLSPEHRARGVVAASAGNHAQGVAYAAKELGINATIFMPVGASLPKYQATLDFGAEVILTGQIVDETMKAAREFTEKSGAVLIPPFDDRDVVIGQGTVGLEILQDLPDVDNILVCLGGGGLAAGVATVAKLMAAKRGKKINVLQYRPKQQRLIQCLLQQESRLR